MKSALICGVGILGLGSLEAQESPATAAGSAKAIDSAAASAGDSKPAATPSAREFPEKEFYTKEEVRALRKVLEAKSQQLDQDIETQKSYVENLKKQVSEQLAKMDAARNEIADFMNARDEKEETKLKKLARFYEAMDAEQAAPLFAKIEDELAIKIFDRMDTKKAGAVLALVPPQRAAKITSSFPRLRLQAGSKAQEAQ
jgi:flagellar motility protein MotE (MotC chaperone)